jgi:hypothetical protein
MGCVNNRNPPFSPFSVNSVTEIRRPPYKRGVSSVIPVDTATTEAPDNITTDDGRWFLLTGAEPYTRMDGTVTTLLCWNGACAVCGAGFTVKTPRLLTGTKAFGRKHCEAHKLKREAAHA